ncbi:MAG TPA: NADH-quinone oxidoreductase subunit C [Acidimicrobiales bacterium]|nr:NADH-quinone oxidoreductase subunit C [Acidimicrobiales bacterium]
MSGSGEMSDLAALEGQPLCPGVRATRVSAAAVAGAVEEMAARENSRLADFFGAVEEGALVLRLVYALDPAREYLVIEWPAEGPEYPSLSDVDPAAFVEECEIYEQFGVRPAAPKLLNRLVVPPHAGADFPRLGAPPPREATTPHAAHYVTGEAIEFPVGPVRAVAQESLYMGLVTSGEEVIDLYLLQWHKHRAVERRLQGLSPEQALFVVERTEGLSAVANSWAFCRAAEALHELELPEPIEAGRAVALELERLYNHAAAVAALCQTTGLSVGQAQAEIALEELLRVNLASFGHRYLFGAVALGGPGRPLDPDALARLLPRAYDELRRAIESLWSTNSFMDRLEACGVVSTEQAGRLGLVGPVARASGRDLDTRRDHPFGLFGALPTRVAVRQKGDALARMEVMAEEAEESVRLVTALNTGPTFIPARMGPGGSAPGANGQAGAALGWCESPRGESLVWLSLGHDGRVERARLRPGSARNWRAFDDAARSRNVFTDIPIIEASFWLTVAGFAR